MREDMDTMLTQVRDYVFKTDEALKEAQRSVARDGAAQETAALRELRDDMWALEDKVREAKWCATAAQQAELANQIDPLMIQVMSKCQQHREQVKACQGLLGDIVSWCERGTSAYRFAVHESAVSKAPGRYSCSPSPSAASNNNNAADGGQQGKGTPSASRIPTYKSPTKQHKASQGSRQQQQQSQQPPQVKVQSRIPAPRLARESLPDTEQQGSTPDQSPHSRGQQQHTNMFSGAADSSKAAGSTAGTTTASRVAAFQRGAAAAAPAAGAGGGGRVSGLVAAAAAAFENGRPAAAAPAAVQPRAVPPAAAKVAATSAPGACQVESFVPLDLDTEECDDDDDEQQQQQLVVPPSPPQPAAAAAAAAAASAQAVQQQQQQRQLSHSSSSNGSMAGLAGRVSGTRVPPRSLLQLEPSRDDVALSSAGQLLQQAAVAPAAAEAEAAAGALGGSRTSALWQQQQQQGDSSHHARGLQLKVPPRQIGGYAAGTDPAATSAAGADAGCSSLNEFPEFGPLRSFTPMVSQHQVAVEGVGVGARSSSSSHYHHNPYVAPPPPPGAAGMGIAGSGSGAAAYVAGSVGVGGGVGGGGSVLLAAERGSLRTSQDISVLLRSGMLMEAALLSSNASRMHVIHDAVAKKPTKPEGAPEVPVVPKHLAVAHRKRPWWAQAARVVVGTAAMAVAGAAGAAAASKNHQGGDSGEGAAHGLPGLLARAARGSSKGRSSGGGSSSRRQQQGQHQAVEEAAQQLLPFMPLGPAPDASAGCG